MHTLLHARYILRYTPITRPSQPSYTVTPPLQPLEAGLGFTVDWSKDFIGKGALQQQKASGTLGKRLVTLHTANAELPVWGGETIQRDGAVVGNVTSAGFAPSVGGQVAPCGRKSTGQGEQVAPSGGVGVRARGRGGIRGA